MIVTKYWDLEKTLEIQKHSKKYFQEIFFGLWENRIENIKEKNIAREHVHFIGNIQSQKIAEITKYCSTIHSLSSLKHAIKINNQWITTQVFIQIKLDKEKNIWISEFELWDFISACKDLKYLEIIGISGMWAWDISENKKRQEFQTLVSLRDSYIPNWLISAGTSRDYHIAINEWIDIVRVGRSILK